MTGASISNKVSSFRKMLVASLIKVMAAFSLRRPSRYRKSRNFSVSRLLVMPGCSFSGNKSKYSRRLVSG